MSLHRTRQAHRPRWAQREHFPRPIRDGVQARLVGGRGRLAWVAFDRHVAEGDDADRLLPFDDRETTHRVLAHQLDRPVEVFVRAGGDQIIAARVGHRRLLRVRSFCERPHHQVT